MLRGLRSGVCEDSKGGVKEGRTKDPLYKDSYLGSSQEGSLSGPPKSYGTLINRTPFSNGDPNLENYPYQDSFV